MQNAKSFLETLLTDLISFVQSPTSFSRQILERKNIISRYLLVFVTVSHSYYLFLPSYLILLNVIGILVFFIIIGMIYYFSQEAVLILEEESGRPFDDDRFFYVVAYCYGLASAIGMILNILTNILALVFCKFLIVGIFVATICNIPITLLVLFYYIKVTQAISPASNPVTRFFELVSQSFITTCKEGLGFKAIGDMMVDWRELR